MSQTTEQINQSTIGDILENSLRGNRPSPADCLRLLDSDDVHLELETAGLSPDQALDTVDTVIDLAIRRPSCLFPIQVSKM